MNGASSRNVRDRAAEFLRLQIPAKFERPRGLYLVGVCLLVVVTTALVGSLYEGPWYLKIWYGFSVSFLLPVVLLLGLLIPFLAVVGLWRLIRNGIPSGIDALRAARGRHTGAHSAPTPRSAH